MAKHTRKCMDRRSPWTGIVQERFFVEEDEPVPCIRMRSKQMKTYKPQHIHRTKRREKPNYSIFEDTVWEYSKWTMKFQCSESIFSEFQSTNLCFGCVYYFFLGGVFFCLPTYIRYVQDVGIHFAKQRTTA